MPQSTRKSANARCLATQADFGADFMSLFNHAANHPPYRLILLVEKFRMLCRVAVHATRELRQVIAAYGKSLEAFCKYLREDDIRGNLAHDVRLAERGRLL
jgi:hypothetical protein